MVLRLIIAQFEVGRLVGEAKALNGRTSQGSLQ